MRPAIHGRLPARGPAIVIAALIVFTTAFAYGQEPLAPLPLSPPPLLPPSPDTPDTSAASSESKPSQAEAVSDWSKGDRIPAGYHAETRPRTAMLIGGASALVGGYALGAYAAVTETAGQWHEWHNWGFVPVLGPVVWVAEMHSGDRGLDIVADTFYLGIAAAQAAGIALIALGLSLPQTVLVPDRAGHLRMSPLPMMLGSRGAGLGLVGSF